MVSKVSSISAPQKHQPTPSKIDRILRKAKSGFALGFQLLKGEAPLRKITGFNKQVYNYLLSVSLRETLPLRQLREETANMPMAGMIVPPEQGQFMSFLAQLIGAKKVLEVGVFTGYSSLSVASVLPQDGKIVACDVSEEYTSVARRYWAKAGVADKIDLHLAPALETLDALIQSKQAGSFDMAFIDADKLNHPVYYERALQLVRTGGLILLDNALWFGKVAYPKYQDKDTQALRMLNQKLHNDERINLSFLPIGDGLVLAMKR